eukprot:86838-Rhodomonas_salina.4
MSEDEVASWVSQTPEDPSLRRWLEARRKAPYSRIYSTEKGCEVGRESVRESREEGRGMKGRRLEERRVQEKAGQRRTEGGRRTKHGRWGGGRREQEVRRVES